MTKGLVTSRKAPAMYLDLMKKTLSFSLWPEPPVPVDMFEYKRFRPVSSFLAVVSRLLELGQLQLVKQRAVGRQQREEGSVLPGYADTMIGLKRLDNLQYCIETALEEGVPGDLIETGVWRGGACIFMRAVLAAYAISDRKVYLADSFDGLPKPDPASFPVDKGDRHYRKRYLAISQDEVANNFRKYELLDDQVVFLKGWFKDTLPTAPIDRLAVLRLDGDMYGSTMDALNHLYPKLSSGGFCIIDDYGLRRCKQAVDDYRREHGIQAELKTIDWSGRYWRKS